MSTLKIGGLAFSISVVLLMLAYVEYQWQYDAFQENGTQIFRVQNDQYKDGELKVSSAMTYAGIGPLLVNSFPDVENQVRLAKWIGNDVVFQFEDKAIRTPDFFFTEPAFFDIFSFKLKRGNPSTALKAPNSLIISSSVAKKLFGDEDPVGQEVRMESRKAMTITGVMEDLPAQSHLKFDMLASLSTWDGSGLDDQGVYGDNHLEYFYAYTYLLLSPKVDAQELAQQLTQIVQKRKATSLIQDIFTLQPLSDIHLYSNLQYELQDTGHGNDLWILLSISLIILILAWVNYFNISTARMLDHSKSIGVKKVMGASRGQVTIQLFFEHLFYTAIGLVLGVFLAESLSGFIEQAFNIQLAPLFTLFIPSQKTLAIISLLVFLALLLSPIFPAIVLSSFKPIQLFKGQMLFPGLHLNLRKVLVVFQFMVIIGLLAGSAVIYLQNQYMKQSALGINLSNVLAIRGPLGTSVYQNIDPAHASFKNKVEHIAGVNKVAMANEIPGHNLEFVPQVFEVGKEAFFSINRLVVSTDFFDLFQLPFLAGGIPRTDPSGKNWIVINESAMDQMGIREPKEALNKKLVIWEEEVKVIGVVKDYHHLSLHHPIIPTFFDIMNGAGMEDGYIMMKMEPKDYSSSIAQIEEAFISTYPNTVFEHFDLADNYYHQYRSDSDFRQLNLLFTLMAFFIAFLGLLGLSMMVLQKRLKEISIRKILGASVTGILVLLSKDFLKLVIIGWILAIPISWYLLSNWLDHFAYRIEMAWWIFALAGLIPIFITIFTVSLNAIKMIFANPVEALKVE